MAHNPQAPHGSPAPEQDPAGSTQMFQAFVDEGPSPARSPQGTSPSGSRTGLIVGGVAAVAAVVVLLFLVLG